MHAIGHESPNAYENNSNNPVDSPHHGMCLEQRIIEDEYGEQTWCNQCIEKNGLVVKVLFLLVLR